MPSITMNGATTVLQNITATKDNITFKAGCSDVTVSRDTLRDLADMKAPRLGKIYAVMLKDLNKDGRFTGNRCDAWEVNVADGLIAPKNEDQPNKAGVNGGNIYFGRSPYGSNPWVLTVLCDEDFIGR